MLISTDEIRQLLESKGITRDNSNPFTFAGYQSKTKRILVIDESSTLQETDMLIDDCQIQGANDIADAIKEIVKKKTQKR